MIGPPWPPRLGPGIYDLSAEAYHRDPALEPSLNASSAHRILTATPRHAWWDNARLNPAWEPTDRDHFDIGSAFHELALGKGRGIKEIEVDDFKTKAAREARETARAEGFVALKSEHFALVHRMTAMAHAQLDQASCGNPLRDASLEREITIIWEQDGILCRAMIDLLDRANRIAWDLKTCAGLAEPEGWLRKSMDHGADLRAAHYLEGLEATLGGSWRYVFVVIEKEPPHCLSIPEISEGAQWMGRQKMDVARSGWRRSLREDRWAGWPLEITRVEPPEYAQNRWVAQAQAQEARFKPKPSAQALANAAAFMAPPPRPAS